MTPLIYQQQKERIGRETAAAIGRKPIDEIIREARNRYRNLWLAFVDSWPSAHRQAFLHMQQKADERREANQQLTKNLEAPN